MTSEIDLSEGCPRCGGAMLKSRTKANKRVICQECKALWDSDKSWLRECIARDLDGSRAAKRPGKDWLTAPESEWGLKRELSELVAMASYETLQTVVQAINASIIGRNEMIEQNGDDSDSLSIEIKALKRMGQWVENEMKRYGEGVDLSSE